MLIKKWVEYFYLSNLGFAIRNDMPYSAHHYAMLLLMYEVL